MPTDLKAQLLHLLNLIEDEFRADAEVRVRPSFASGTQRAADLEQDYDPEASSLHQESGVIVQTRRRSYYFPSEWVRPEERKHLLAEIDRIREELAGG